MTYLANIEGFENSFHTVADLKAWAETLIRRHPDLLGKTCKVWKAKAPGVFGAAPTREITIGA